MDIQIKIDAPCNEEYFCPDGWTVSQLVRSCWNRKNLLPTLQTIVDLLRAGF